MKSLVRWTPAFARHEVVDRVYRRRKTLDELFDALDEDGDGYICAADFEGMLGLAGSPNRAAQMVAPLNARDDAPLVVSRRTCNAMFDAADKEKLGVLSRAQFLAYVAAGEHASSRTMEDLLLSMQEAGAKHKMGTDKLFAFLRGCRHVYM